MRLTDLIINNGIKYPLFKLLVLVMMIIFTQFPYVLKKNVNYQVTNSLKQLLKQQSLTNSEFLISRFYLNIFLYIKVVYLHVKK